LPNDVRVLPRLAHLGKRFTIDKLMTQLFGRFPCAASVGGQLLCAFGFGYIICSLPFYVTKA
jgi:hypothetical protein